MDLARLALNNRAVTYFFGAILAVGGVGAFFGLGQLEDPDFSVKTAVVSTAYPGASPQEVEQEVTDRIELALQELPEIDNLESYSRRGLSSVIVNIKSEYWSDRLPQVWDKLRSKIRDVEDSLPPGVQQPIISDDFGSVFGFQLAVTGDGFSDAELEQYAKDIKKQLSLVKGVARVDLWGSQTKVIYVDVAQQRLSEIGLSVESFTSTLNQQNMVVDAGSLDLQDNRYPIVPSGQYQSPEDISDLMIRPSLTDEAGQLHKTGRSDELIRLGDVAQVREGYAEPPMTLMRFNGEPSVGISLTNVAGVNVVAVGQAIDARLKQLTAVLPVGMEVHKVHWMSDVVEQSVSSFLISFAQAVAIVLIVITIGMGWRMSVIIGTALVATILGSFILMSIFGIDLQRMSLGALIIALGMMVDNAIVVADGYLVRRQQGMSPEEAAIAAAGKPSMPLLGATVIAVMAFYPVFASVEDAGEYCRTLFSVVGIALLFSWLVSMTITPVQCVDQMRDVKGAGGEGNDAFDTPFFRGYRSLLRGAIGARWLTIGVMLSLLVVAVLGFGNVKQLFFPDASMTKFMVDYWAPEGTRIQQVAADLRSAEDKLLDDERIDSVASFIGSGPPRFYLPVDPESPYQSYGQLIVNVKDYEDIDDLINELDPWFRQQFPNAEVPMRKYGVGPSYSWKLELRISGPEGADPGVLRELADQGVAAVSNSPLSGITRVDWRQRTQMLVPEYDQKRARWTGISRENVADTTKRAFDGRVVGQYREGDDLIPIVVRHEDEARTRVSGLDTLQVSPSMSTETVPLAVVTDGIMVEWEDPMIWRRDRRRTITIQSNPVPGVTFPSLRTDVLPAVDAIELPPGYSLEWGGEQEGTVDAQASLLPGVVPAVVIVLFVIVMLFNAFRPMLIIIATIPFALIGISGGLLLFNTPFGFLALLGAMSLAGMMIKNAIVLLDEVNANLDLGQGQYDAVVNAGTSRLRPVMLAAATTVLGVVPLLPDLFWVGLAVTVMAGLSFGTVLTMILVPTLYATFYGVRRDKEDEKAVVEVADGEPGVQGT